MVLSFWVAMALSVIEICVSMMRMSISCSVKHLVLNDLSIIVQTGMVVLNGLCLAFDDRSMSTAPGDGLCFLDGCKRCHDRSRTEMRGFAVDDEAFAYIHDFNFLFDGVHEVDVFTGAILVFVKIGDGGIHIRVMVTIP